MGVFADETVNFVLSCAMKIAVSIEKVREKTLFDEFSLRTLDVRKLAFRAGFSPQNGSYGGIQISHGS